MSAPPFDANTLTVFDNFNMVENKRLMDLFIPESSALARMSPRNRQFAPFVEVDWVEPNDPDYEDLVYETYGTFYSPSGNDVLRRVRLEQTVADLSSAVSSVFTGDGSPAFSIRDALDISTHVAHMLTRPRYTSWDLRKSEIWIIHGDHELSDAVLITSKLVQAHFENCYEGADLRGILSVAIKGKTWLCLFIYGMSLGSKG